MSEGRCVSTIRGIGGFRSFPCGNRARYGKYCGVHSPEKQAERAKARGPTQLDVEYAARATERDRVRDIEARLAVYDEAFVNIPDPAAAVARWQGIEKAAKNVCYWKSAPISDPGRLHLEEDIAVLRAAIEKGEG